MRAATESTSILPASRRCYPFIGKEIFQLLGWLSANSLQHIILWLFIIESKVGCFQSTFIQINFESNLLTYLLAYINMSITNVSESFLK